MNRPELTVIIPLYNHGGYIARTLASVLEQSFDDFELLIIDDGSTDNSVAVVREITDKRIILLNQENHGAHYTLNRGISRARGRYISILNSDDLYAPQRLERCYQLMEKEPGIDIVCTGVQCIDGAGSPLHCIDSAPLYRNRGRRDHRDQVIALDLLADNFLISTSNIFCRSSLFDTIGGFRGFRYCHDWDFFLRASLLTHLRLLPEPLLNYRIHQANTLAQDKAAVYFEMGLVLADFFRSHDLTGLVPAGSLVFEEEICRSLRYHYVDRILAVLGMTKLSDSQWQGMLEKHFAQKTTPFHRAGRDYIRQLLENDACVNQVFDENRELRQQLERLQKTSGPGKGLLAAITGDAIAKIQRLRSMRRTGD